MPAPTPTTPSAPPPQRRRVRVLAAILATATLLIVAAHRLVLGALLHAIVVAIAARDHVALEFNLHGSILTGVTFQNVRAHPTGSTPVDSIAIEQIRIQYDLLRLLRHGWGDGIAAYRLRNAQIVLIPERGTREQQAQAERILRSILQQPALFSDRVQVENFNLTVLTPDGPLRVGGAHAFLDPVQPGSIRIEELALPRLGAWRQIEAKATYANRHLIARRFHLGNDLQGERLELDASQRAQGINYLSFEGKVLGAETGLFLWRQEIDRRHSHAQLNLFVSGLPLERVSAFRQSDPAMSGTVSRLWLQLSGNPDEPAQWFGNGALDAAGIAIAGRPLDAAVSLHALGGRLTGEARFTQAAGNAVLLSIDQPLADTVPELWSNGVRSTVTLHAPALPAVFPWFTQGGLEANGELHLQPAGGSVALHATRGERLAWRQGNTPWAVESGSASLESTWPWRPHPDRSPKVTLTFPALQQVRIGAWQFDTASAEASWEPRGWEIPTLKLTRGPNHFSGGGHYHSSATAGVFPNVQLQGVIEAPDLAAFSAEANHPLAGSLRGNGSLELNADGFRWRGRIEGDHLQYRQFVARHGVLESAETVVANAAEATRLELDLGDQGRLLGQVALHGSPPFRYAARLSGTVPNLSVFEPLVGVPLAGSLTLDWQGEGDLNAQRHSGRGSGVVTRGRAGSLTGIEAAIEGEYSPEAIRLPRCKLESDQGGIETRLELNQARLQADPLQLRLGKTARLVGALSLPLDLRTPTRPKTIFPPGAITGRLTLQPLRLADALPPGSPLHGTISGTLSAAGTTDAPELEAVLAGQNLGSDAVRALPPCSGALSLQHRGGQLLLNTALSEPGLAPLQITAALPLSLRALQAWVTEHRVDPATPIAAALRLPPSPAGLLTLLLPQVRLAEGRIAADATVTGSLGQPWLNGGLKLDLTALRFQSVNAPMLGQLHGDLRLSGTTLTVQELRGEIAGGPFSMAGSVRFAHPDDPQLDLRFRSQGTLLARNDALTLRADSDLGIVGPLATAQVKGKIGVNQSRLFRDIEILPIGLRGRQAPKSSPATFRPSLDFAPVRDWSFDVGIKTTEPFLVRSNLARGRAEIDAHLGGTGLAPALEGSARLENFVASLPFSRLTIDYGTLFFSPDAPFDPTLDIHGSTRIRGYSLNAYIYGTASEPQTLFTSEPSLAQEEILTLIATGATMKEVTENNQALAGRAGVLLLQDLYHKVFKPRTPSADAPANDIADRFSLDVGTVDPRSGRQEIDARFKLSDQYEIGAGVDVQGDVRAQFRYLLRFR